MVVAVSAIYLALWGLMWRLLLTNPLPSSLYVLPLTALICVVAAFGLMSVRGAPSSQLARLWSGLVIVVAALVLIEYLLGMPGGLEQYVFQNATRSLLGGSAPGRPAPQAALILLFLGLALWFMGKPRIYRFDFADLGIGMALFLSFTSLLGHLYEAKSLYQSAGGGTVSMSLMETLLLLLLSLSALSLNPQGVVAGWSADDAAGAAKRRLIPAIVVTPVLLGLVQYLSVKYQALEFPVALALSVTANIVVFLSLSEWVARLLARIEVERTGDFAQREHKAKEEGMTDMLTTLLNRRGWDLAVKQSEERCAREGLNACVVVIDLDGLKRINDTEGHASGDEFIRRAGSALKLAARREDVLARLGGDEFACLTLGCAPEHAGVVLKRISQSLQKGGVPASLGYAMRDLAGSIGAAFQEADHAMYAHKRARKSQASPAPAAVKTGA